MEMTFVQAMNAGLREALDKELLSCKYTAFAFTD